MVGNLKIGDQITQTNIKFRNINEYESFINAIVIFIKSTLLNLTWLIAANMELVVISNMNFLKIEVIFVSYQRKVIVLLNVLIV